MLPVYAGPEYAQGQKLIKEHKGNLAFRRKTVRGDGAWKSSEGSGWSTIE